jgi:probable addiction module antidote protein
MLLAPSEQQLWVKLPKERPLHVTDAEINERYARGEGRIVIETNREKIPGFVGLLQQPNYMDLRPFYQRRPRWSVAKQSLLIESFIMNIPVPPVFLYEKEYNSYEVMDGQQRITALQEFFGGKFELSDLKQWPEINGRTYQYQTLPEKIKAGLDRRSITSIVLLKESTSCEEEASSLRETVFERLNTGGVELTRQEIRNALYRGRMNNLIDRLSRMPVFRKAWGIPCLFRASWCCRLCAALRWRQVEPAPRYRQGKTHGEGIEGERAMKKAKAKEHVKENVRANAEAKVTYAPFEVADYLDSEEAVAEYLSLAARDENPGVLLKALGDVAKARGMTEVAKASGLGRESLYKTLAPGAKPRFETIATIMRALNVGFSIESRLPARAKKARKLTAA